MMNLDDFVNAITDYLENSGQNPKDWDVWEAAKELRDAHDVDSIDEIGPDEFTAILEKHSN
jgi:hypothetical protein